MKILLQEYQTNQKFLNGKKKLKHLILNKILLNQHCITVQLQTTVQQSSRINI